MTTLHDTPRIYVACLASYNNGILHGEWIDADQNADAINEEIASMLAESEVPNAEEFAIHDTENFHELVEEYTPIDDVAELGALLAEHGEAYAAYMSHVGAEYATESGFQDAYRGEWKDEEDYAYNDVEMRFELEGVLSYYFDYKAYARDLFRDEVFGVESSEGMLFVFDRN